MSLAPRTKRKPLANVQVTFKAEPALARLLEERASLSKQSRHTLARELVEESLRNEHDVIPVLNRATDNIAGLHELLGGQAEASTLLLQKVDSLDSQYDFLARSLADLRHHITELRHDVRTVCFALLVQAGQTPEAAENFVVTRLSSEVERVSHAHGQNH